MLIVSDCYLYYVWLEQLPQFSPLLLAAPAQVVKAFFNTHDQIFRGPTSIHTEVSLGPADFLLNSRYFGFQTRENRVLSLHSVHVMQF